MKYIELTQGKQAIVDDEDYDWLMQYKWHALNNRGTFYAARQPLGNDRKAPSVRMHREILGLTEGSEMRGDHRDHNGLNNQRSNLRKCLPGENERNRMMSSNNTSGYVGVTWVKAEKKWSARICVNGHRMYLGTFFCVIKAAKTYDTAARKYHKEFASVNFPEEGEQGVRR